MKKIDLTQLSRQQLELATLVVILLCAFSILLMPVDFKKKLTFDDKKIVYVGKVKNSRMNGQGTLTFSNGDQYTGNFVNGQFDGQGTYKSKDGWTYQGEFTKGKADGEGVLTTSKGKTYKGKYKQGIYQK